MSFKAQFKLLKSKNKSKSIFTLDFNLSLENNYQQDKKHKLISFTIKLFLKIVFMFFLALLENLM